MDYISGRLTGKEKHEVEQWMVDNNFANDALEGLQNIKDQKHLEAYVAHLNKELNQYLQNKKKRRDRRKVKQIPWSYLAIVLILLFIIIAYFIIQRLPK
jgi:uncharacterized membrane protein YvbJ